MACPVVSTSSFSIDICGSFYYILTEAFPGSFVLQNILALFLFGLLPFVIIPLLPDLLTSIVEADSRTGTDKSGEVAKLQQQLALMQGGGYDDLITTGNLNYGY